MRHHTVIIGAGHAAGQLIASMKMKNYAGRIVLIGDEPYLPYQRPPLSKRFLAGELPSQRLLFKPPEFYDDERIDVRLDTRVNSIDRGARTVSTDDGHVIDYDNLVIATGASVNRLSCQGSELSGIHYLRTIDDVKRIRAESKDARRVLIVGAGYIGLEVAAVLRQAGAGVVVLELADRVMSRVVSAPVSDFFAGVHREHGVDIRLGTGLAAFHGDDRVTMVETLDGEKIETDMVVVGVGVSPNIDLAASAGLDVDDGVVVDDCCLTSDRRIFAIGDCTSHTNRIYDRRLRLESVQNALEQAKTAGAILCGEDAVYDEVPWFWSDQYEFKLQIAGLSDGFDDIVVRGDPDDKSFSCIYLREGVFIAIDCVNAPRDFMQSKALIAAKSRIEPSALANKATPLAELTTTTRDP